MTVFVTCDKLASLKKTAEKPTGKANEMAKTEAVLVKLEIRTFTNSKKDKAITGEVAAAKNIAPKAGHWKTVLFNPERMKEAGRIASDIRRIHHEMTLPWETGYGLLRTDSMTFYRAKIDALHAELMTEVDSLCAVYQGMIDEAKVMRGASFEPADYPDVTFFKAQFAVTYGIFPVPASSHFGAKVEESMKVALDEAVTKRVDEAVAGLWSRILDPVKRLADVLSADEPKIHESLVRNIKDISDLIPSLNITGDEGLINAANQLKMTLSNLDVPTLRDSKIYRQDAVTAANLVIERFGKVGDRKFAV